MNNKCKCATINIVESFESEEFEEKYLDEISVNADKWTTLFKCRFCKTYWEERDENSRFGISTVLVKVSSDYIKINWGVPRQK